MLLPTQQVEFGQSLREKMLATASGSTMAAASKKSSRNNGFFLFSFCPLRWLQFRVFKQSSSLSFWFEES